jgi:mono/diheme cytochrome c family protein
MGSTLIRWSTTILASIALATAHADEPAPHSTPRRAGPSGAALFKTYCASCHGTTGRGDGPVAKRLARKPPDLTRLAQRNGGNFDADQLRRVIDGRQPVKGHGRGEMPVWGDAFQGSDESSAEAVRARIEALVEYLRSIQTQ